MIIAQEKRHKNIAEYILYMWQVEDTIRACKFDMNVIENRIIDQYQLPESTKDDLRNWYSDLILMMHDEKVTEKGHIKLISALIDELEELHISLVNTQRDPQYLNLYDNAKPNIDAFAEKLKNGNSRDISLCFQALYALLLMRLQKKTISGATMQSMNTFSQLLAALSTTYLKVENGQIEKP